MLLENKLNSNRGWGFNLLMDNACVTLLRRALNLKLFQWRRKASLKPHLIGHEQPWRLSLGRDSGRSRLAFSEHHYSLFTTKELQNMSGECWTQLILLWTVFSNYYHDIVWQFCASWTTAEVFQCNTGLSIVLVFAKLPNLCQNKS